MLPGAGPAFCKENISKHNSKYNLYRIEIGLLFLKIGRLSHLLVNLRYKEYILLLGGVLEKVNVKFISK